MVAIAQPLIGTASGPILFNHVAATERNQLFQANTMIVLLALALIVPCIGQSPLMTNQGRLRLGYVIRMAKIPMVSSFVGGVTFFGLPAFLTLYGLMNGMSLKNASLLLTAFMLGSVASLRSPLFREGKTYLGYYRLCSCRCDLRHLSTPCNL